MNLQGSIGKLQSIGVQLYLQLNQCFKDNNLIREIWVAMAQDKEEQARCLGALPPHFWTLMKTHEGLEDAVQACLGKNHVATEPGSSLQQCLVRIFEFEEPIILKIYVPLIRHLRISRSYQALDLYIATKAHVARLTRVIQSFSGNPNLIERSTGLHEGFEKAVQAPEAVPVSRPGKKPFTQSASVARHPKAKTKHAVSAKKRARAASSHRLGNRVKGIAKRVKPLVKKIALSRRRARP